MGVDGHLYGISIMKADSKEHGKVEFVTACINVFGNIFTDYWVS